MLLHFLELVLKNAGEAAGYVDSFKAEGYNELVGILETGITEAELKEVGLEKMKPRRMVKKALHDLIKQVAGERDRTWILGAHRPFAS